MGGGWESLVTLYSQSHCHLFRRSRVGGVQNSAFLRNNPGILMQVVHDIYFETIILRVGVLQARDVGRTPVLGQGLHGRA